MLTNSGEYSVGLLQVWLLPDMLTTNALAAALLNLELALASSTAVGNFTAFC